jgi:hypothetical protein
MKLKNKTYKNEKNTKTCKTNINIKIKTIRKKKIKR